MPRKLFTSTKKEVAAMNGREVKKLARLADQYVTVDDQLTDLSYQAKELKSSIHDLIVAKVDQVGKTRKIVVMGPDNGRIECAVTHAESRHLDAEKFLKSLPADLRESLMVPVLDQGKLQEAVIEGKISQKMIDKYITTAVSDRVKICRAKDKE